MANAAARLSSRLAVKSEMRILADHLNSEDTVELLASAWFHSGQGLLVLTDRRLVFVKGKRIGTAVHGFPVAAISSVTWAACVVMGTLGVYVNGSKSEFTAVSKQDGLPIVDRIGVVIGGLVPEGLPTPPSGFGVSDVPLRPRTEAPIGTGDVTAFRTIVEQLRQLAELRDTGIISTADFEARKAELLARI